MAPRTTGTYDFYFDMADKLQELGTEFSFAVRPEGADGVVVFSNVEDVKIALAMVRSQDNMFRERFGDKD